MEIPESMRVELATWNNGAGIDLESWIGCAGNFKLAVGYSQIFWPTFENFEGYLLRSGFSLDSLRGFEYSCKKDRRAIESVMNHLHIADIHSYGCDDISRDKIQVIGQALKEIYTAKLAWQFPRLSTQVSLFVPNNPDDLADYEITFFQTDQAAT
jgi:hypothetical protein